MNKTEIAMILNDAKNWFHGTLTKIESLPNGTISDHPLRTNSVEGFCIELPEVGKKFLLFGDALEEETEEAFRVVQTSLVMCIESQGVNVLRFATENSVFEFKGEFDVFRLH